MIFDSWQNLSLVNDRDFVRVVNLDDNSFESFRIRINKDIRDSKNVLKRRLYCEHLKYDMLEELYAAWTPYVQASPSIILGEILTNSAFSVGTMSSSTLMDITLRFTSMLDLLVEVQDVLETDLVVNENKTVSFITRGSDRGARIRYAKNLKFIERTKDGRSVSNKIFGFGGGSPPAEIGQNDDLGFQGAEHIITALSGATITAHNRLVSSDDGWNNFYAEMTRASNAALIGSAISIVDSISPNQIVLDSVFTNLTVGDYFRINLNVGKDPLKYVKDQTSVDSLGEIDRAILYNDIIIATNLLISADLSGNYVDDGDGAKDDQWSAVTIGGGSIALSENSAQTFIQFGTTSQHCLNADSGEGISQAVTLVDTNIYSVMVWIFVITGTVELVFFDGTAIQPFTITGLRAETSTTGVWIQLLLEGVTADGTAGDIRVLSRSANAEFYVDSLMLEKSSKISAPTDFYPISGARRLWDRSFDALQNFKDISNEYLVNLVDLFEADPDNYPYDLILVGDTVTIQDDDLSIDVAVRVQSKRWNVFEPQEAKIEVNNLPKPLTRQARSQKQFEKRNDLQLAQLRGFIREGRILEASGLIIGQQETARRDIT